MSPQPEPLTETHFTNSGANTPNSTPTGPPPLSVAGAQDDQARPEQTERLSDRALPPNIERALHLTSALEPFLNCSSCKKAFNTAFLVQDYTITRNRPVQCHCSCTMCLKCYTEETGCRTHNLRSRHAPLNTPMDTLSSYITTSSWNEAELDHEDSFATEARITQELQGFFVGQASGPDNQQLQLSESRSLPPLLLLPPKTVSLITVCLLFCSSFSFFSTSHSVPVSLGSPVE